MARLRVFISSTYYDLRHVRSSLDIFLDAIGFESLMSEKGNIAFAHDVPLDESCYREVAGADIFVLIIGGRYGSATSNERGTVSGQFYNRYESITKKEYLTAAQNDIPVYVLIDKDVYAEYQTFLKNRSTEIVYAHVDSINVFYLIEHILTQRRNNPIHTFERPSEIHQWLREQWAGLFRELIRRAAGRQVLTNLAAQVYDLSEVNKTLKIYLERVLSKISPEDAVQVISSEDERLEEAKNKKSLLESELVKYLIKRYSLDVHRIYDSLFKASSVEDFVLNLSDHSTHRMLREELFALFTEVPTAILDLNDARAVLQLPELENV